MKRPPVRYFRVNSACMSFGELWRVKKWNPIAFLMLIMSKIGIRLIPFPYTNSQKQEWLPIAPDEIPGDVTRRIRPPIKLLEKVGCSVIDYGETPMLESQSEFFSVIMLSEDGRVAATIIDLRQPIKHVTMTTLTTMFQDGTFFITSTESRLTQDPPCDRAHYCPGMSLDRLYAEHLERLEQAEAEGMQIVPWTRSNFIPTMLRSAESRCRHFVERGVFVEIPDDEVEDIFWRRGADQDDEDRREHD